MKTCSYTSVWARCFFEQVGENSFFCDNRRISRGSYHCNSRASRESPGPEPFSCRDSFAHYCGGALHPSSWNEKFELYGSGGTKTGKNFPQDLRFFGEHGIHQGGRLHQTWSSVGRADWDREEAPKLKVEEEAKSAEEASQAVRKAMFEDAGFQQGIRLI